MKLYYKLPYVAIVFLVLFDYGWLSPIAKGTGYLSEARDETYNFVVSSRWFNAPASDNIRVVAIESKDLATNDDDICESLSWPVISRSWFVDVLENIVKHQPKAIVVDFLYLSPSTECPEYDQQLRKIFQDNTNIFTVAILASGETNLSITPKVIPGAYQFQKSDSKFGDAMNYPFFVDDFTKSGQTRLGSANSMVDDLIITKASTWTSTSHWKIPTIPTLLQSYINKTDLKSIEDDEPLINWRSSEYPAENFTDIWLEDYSEVESVKGRFTDKIVLIGTNMPARSVDVHATPLDEKVPGVFVLATIIDNAITQDFIKTHSENVSIALTLFFVTLIFLAFDSQILLPHLGGKVTKLEAINRKLHGAFHMDIAGADFFLVIEVIGITTAFIALEFFGFYFDLSGPVLAGGLAFSLFSLMNYFSNKRYYEDGEAMREYMANKEFTQLHVMSIKGLREEKACFGVGWLVRHFNPNACMDYDTIIARAIKDKYSTGIAELDLFKDDDVFGAAFDERHFWWVAKTASEDLEDSIESILESKLDLYRQDSDKEVMVILSSLDISKCDFHDNQETALCSLILDLLSKANQQYSEQ